MSATSSRGSSLPEVLLALLVATLTILLLIEGLVPSLRLDRAEDRRQQEIDLAQSDLETCVRLAQTPAGYQSMQTTSWSYADPGCSLVTCRQVSAPAVGVTRLVVLTGLALPGGSPALSGIPTCLGTLIREP